MPDRRTPDIDAPVFTDAAGVEWTADRWSPSHPWMLCVCDKPNGQIGFSLILTRGDIDCLPPATDRAEAWAKLQAFAKSNPPANA